MAPPDLHLQVPAGGAREVAGQHPDGGAERGAGRRHLHLSELGQRHPEHHSARPQWYGADTNDARSRVIPSFILAYLENLIRSLLYLLKYYEYNIFFFGVTADKGVQKREHGSGMYLGF